MSDGDKISIQRRRFLVGGVAAVIAGVLSVYTLQTVGFMYRPRHNKQYDDLLSLVWNRENAERIGVIVLQEDGQFEPWKIGPQLRKRIAGRSLQQITALDAEEGRLVEAQGWVLPETVALLCALSTIIH